MEDLKQKIKKKRRDDEASLYYIIDRDLDRDALFEHHDGWTSQVKLDNGFIDYLVNYGDYLIGIEVKAYFPTERDFEQVKKYSNQVDAIFLAYPADWAAQAFFISETNEIGQEVGIISLALFRSHVIRRAKFSKRLKDPDDHFLSLEDYKKSINKRREKGELRYYKLEGSILNNEGFCSYIDNDGFPSENYRPNKIKLAPREYNALAALYFLETSISPFRGFTFENIQKILDNHIKPRNVKYSAIYEVGELLTFTVSYGYQEELYSLKDGVYMFEDLFLEILKEKFELNNKKIEKITNKLKKKHLKKQSIERENFLAGLKER